MNVTALSPGELSRFGITAPIFDRLREARPTGIAWLREAAERVPDLPGLASVGVGDELRMLRVADASLRAVARQAGESGLFAADRDRTWIAWQVIET